MNCYFVLLPPRDRSTETFFRPSKMPNAIGVLIFMTLCCSAHNLAIGNTRHNNYYSSSYNSNYETTTSPYRSSYANSFSNPSSLTSFFSPDRYGQFSNYLKPPMVPLNYQIPNYGIKLFPQLPHLTNHFHQKIPPTKNPPTTSTTTTNRPTTTASTTYPTTSYPLTYTMPTKFPTSAPFESMDSSPIIVRPHVARPFRRPPRPDYSTAFMEASSPPTLSPFLPTQMPHNHTSSNEDDSPGGSLGLLYVFSEATKRLPVTDLPKRMEVYGNNFATWGEDTVKGFEKQAVTLGDTLVELIQSAAKDVTIKAGELISNGIDSLERNVKSYLSDWIGCEKPKG